MLTNYGAALYGGFIFGDTTAPAALYLALIKTTPTAASTGATIVEPTPVDYDRVRVDNLTWSSSVSLGTETHVLTDSFFYVPAADWGTVTYFGITDSATVGAGNLIHYGLMPSAIDFVVGQKVVIPSNSISLQAV